MAFIGLDHVQLAIPANGEGLARKFYVGLLGMSEIAKPAQLSPSGCWFEGGNVQIHLGVDPDFKPARKAHPAVLVNDLDQLRDRLEGQGVETVRGEGLAGYRRFFAFDPFGNRLEFMEQA